MIGPISPASFPCGEIPRHRKKAVKKTPAKAKHKHDYEPVILRYINQHSVFRTDQGFIPGTDYAPGQACRICGKLVRGFADEFPVITTRLAGCHVTLKPEYQHLRQIEVKSLFDLEEI